MCCMGGFVACHVALGCVAASHLQRPIALVVVPQRVGLISPILWQSIPHCREYLSYEYPARGTRLLRTIQPMANDFHFVWAYTKTKQKNILKTLRNSSWCERYFRHVWHVWCVLWLHYRHDVSWHMTYCCCRCQMCGTFATFATVSLNKNWHCHRNWDVAAACAAGA